MESVLNGNNGSHEEHERFLAWRVDDLAAESDEDEDIVLELVLT